MTTTFFLSNASKKLRFFNSTAAIAPPCGQQTKFILFWTTFSRSLFSWFFFEDFRTWAAIHTIRTPGIMIFTKNISIFITQMFLWRRCHQFFLTNMCFLCFVQPFINVINNKHWGTQYNTKISYRYSSLNNLAWFFFFSEITCYVFLKCNKRKYTIIILLYSDTIFFPHWRCWRQIT